MMKRRFLALVLLAPAFASGCLATQSNVRDLQAELVQMRQASQAQQERLLREIQRQNEIILDSLQLQDVRLRGDVSSQLVRIERQLVQIQELTGQGQQQLAEFRAALQAREEALRRAEAALVAQQSQDADELFETAEGALERGLASTARNGFQEFVDEFPDHEKAPAARLNLAGILSDADEEEQALEEYARIVELHADTPEAPTALFRAALIERGRGNGEKARSMFNQLTAAYPGSPEAGQARTELRRR